MKGAIGNIMRQAQEMQASLKKAQDELARIEVEGEAGAGMVKVIMTGLHRVKRVTIEPALMGEDKEMLEDLLAAAVNDAVSKIESTTKEKMAGLTSSLGLPPGINLPF